MTWLGPFEQLASVDAASVVSHDHAQTLVGIEDLQLDRLWVGMANGVAQGLLHDQVDRLRDRDRERSRGSLNAGGEDDVRALDHGAADGRQRPLEVIRTTELAAQRLDAIPRLVHRLLRDLHGVAQALPQHAAGRQSRWTAHAS